jgi:hypothetical protein
LTEQDSTATAVKVIEAHEEFIQHLEAGSSKIRGLAIITIAVSLLLGASYLYQVLLPYISNERIVIVNLLDPALVGAEILLLGLVLAWFYIGVRDYLFVTRLARIVREIRSEQKEIEKRITG